MINGIVREIDTLGRLVIPMETRKMLGLVAHPYADMWLDGKIVHIKMASVFSAKGYSKGIVRKLDSLGRICIPKEYRKVLHIENGAAVDMWMDGSEICVQRAEYGCGWCGGINELMEVKGHHICRECAYAVVDAVMEE